MLYYSFIAEFLIADRVDYEQFMQIISMCWSNSIDDDLINAMQRFDKDKNGLIPLAEFKYELLNRGEKLSEDEFDFILENIRNEFGYTVEDQYLKINGNSLKKKSFFALL